MDKKGILTMLKILKESKQNQRDALEDNLHNENRKNFLDGQSVGLDLAIEVINDFLEDK